MTTSNNNRQVLQKMLDKITELEKYEPKKETMRTDTTLWYAVERIFIALGELVDKGRGAMSELTKPVFRQCKDFRNKLAHNVDTDVEKVIKAFDVLSDVKSATKDVIDNMYSEDSHLCNFELFGGFGSRNERQRYIDALTDKLANPNSDEPISFPNQKEIKKISDATEAIINHPELLKLSQENQEIAREIAQDIAKWAKKVHKEILKDNPFEYEENFYQYTKDLNIDNFSKQFGSIKKELSTKYTDGDLNLSYFVKKNQEFRELSKSDKLQDEDKKKLLEQQEALKSSFLKDWEKQLTNRRLDYELNLIDEARKEFTDELYKRLEDFQKLKEILIPFTDDLGRLWDMSGGVWKRTGFDILRKYGELLEQDNSLNELTDLLGKFRKSESEFEQEMFEEIVIKHEWKVEHAQKSEFIGIRESDDLSTMLPSETALLANIDTQSIFLKKFAEKKLVTFDYNSKILSAKEEKKQINRQKEKEEDKGPIIICVDTSGSMKGTPEQIAKVLCFAILKVAMKDMRQCYLISFSTAIHTINLTDLPSSLDKLIDFLSMAFQGGTDATPAIKEALKMLTTSEYKKSDVLLISDFIMPIFDSTTQQQIESAKENNTHFHSLTISSTGNTNTINSFDHNWIYNPTNKNSMLELVKNMKEMSNI